MADDVDLDVVLQTCKLSLHATVSRLRESEHIARELAKDADMLADHVTSLATELCSKELREVAGMLRKSHAKYLDYHRRHYANVHSEDATKRGRR